MHYQPGDMAPDFELPDQEGRRFRLSSMRGRWVLLYFYPKDDTPGCTTEACVLRDRIERFSSLALEVVGVSPDGILSHRKFADRFSLPFSLLSDPRKDVIQNYGAWGEKMFMGKTSMGVLRSSFLIDPCGRIAKVYPKVNPQHHADEVERDLEELSQSPQPCAACS